jgi:hypothetical protein
MIPRLPLSVEFDPVVLPGAPTTGAAADLDAALRRMCDLVAIRERMRIAEFMYVAAAYGDLALGWMLAASGTCSLEEARASLAIGDRRAGSDGRATGEIPN